MWTIVVGAQLCGLSILDIRRKCLPLIAVMAIFITVVIQCLCEPTSFGEYVASALVGGGFLLISRLSREALGYGDSLLILILGIQLGFWGLLATLTYSMFLLGVSSLIYLVLKGNHREISIPFVPILTVGYLLAVYT